MRLNSSSKRVLAIGLWLIVGTHWPGNPSEASEPTVVAPGQSLDVHSADRLASTVRPSMVHGSTHWAFAPLSHASLEGSEDFPHGSVTIDLLIDRAIADSGLSPAPAADRRTLLRRVSLDLIGLPPPTDWIAEVLTDESEGWYERLVDRLLESPRFGEHFARYWLELVRYGDTHGLHLDNYREIWPYRDYVIESFNENKRFDRFVVEQIAGDLLPDVSRDTLIATGFNRLHLSTNEDGTIPEEVDARNLIDLTTAFGTVFLGLTLQCASCHDHPHDPISQREFYSLLAFFNNLDGKPSNDNSKSPEPSLALPTPQQANELSAVDARLAELNLEAGSMIEAVDAAEVLWRQSLAREFQAVEHSQADRLEGDLADPLPAEISSILRLSESQRSDSERQALRDHFRSRVCDVGDWRAIFDERLGLEKYRRTLEASIVTTLVWRERAEPRKTSILARGDYASPSDPVEPGVPACFPMLKPRASGTGSSPTPDRLDLGWWLVNDAHALTSRVLVNRIWQQLTGSGLVRTSEDFGIHGDAPSNLDLLNFLAADFVRSGWDIKRLVKQVVMSDAYQRDARATADDLRIDPENRLLARGSRFRLDGETLRDQALSLGSILEHRLGGPAVKPPQPPGLWEAVAYSGSNTATFIADSGKDAYRRSIYTFWKRTSPPPQFSTFDAASREACAPRRERTNTPLQALQLLNEPQMVEAAVAIARTHRDQPIETMFERVTLRPPRAEERRELLELLRDLQAHYEGDPALADSLVGRSGDGGNIELAARAVVANLLLNLDEIIHR